jgi:hypothetical protein
MANGNQLPRGFVLDQPEQQSGLPEGFVLDEPVQAADDTAQVVTEPLPEGSAFDVVAEPIKSIASNLLGTIGGGVAGAITAPFVGAGEATETIQGIQQAASEFGEPETQRGQEALQTVGDLMEKGIDLARFPISGLASIAELISGQGVEQAAKTVKDVQEKGVGKTAGDRVFEETGSPLLASVASVTPELVGSIFPLSKIVKANRAGASAIPSSKINPEIKSPFTPPSKIQAKMAEQIAQGGTDKTLAKYITDGAGKVKTDKFAVESIKQGFDPGVIAAVKGASKVDRAKLVSMVDNMKKGKSNSLFAMKNRPSDIAGDSLMQRIRHVREVNLNAGKRIDVVAKSLKGQAVDSAGPIDSFIQNLDDMGVKLSKDLRPMFKGSDVEGLAAPQNAIKNIVNRLASGKRGTPPDAYELHRMKKFIDENVTYGKAGEGLAGKTERILKKLRVDIDETLDNNFPDYNEVNTIYADTIGALDSIQDVAGRKMNLAGGNADKATGTLLRRMMSNAQSRVNLVDAVDNLEGVSKKYGSSFNDDIATQMLFADELDSVFGAVARTSLQGEVGKSVKKGMETAAGARTVTGAAIDAAAAGVEKLRGINQENAFNSILELLKRE